MKKTALKASGAVLWVVYGIIRLPQCFAALMPNARVFPHCWRFLFATTSLPPTLVMRNLFIVAQLCLF